MSIIFIYIIGCFLSYMRVNAFESYYEQYGIKKDYTTIVFLSLTSWIGVFAGILFFIVEREKGEKFFKL